MTKIVLSKVLQNFKASNCTFWELNQKGISFFPRNIQYRARLKGLPFQFFGTVGLFSNVFFHQRVPLKFFWWLATKQNGWKFSKRPPARQFGWTFWVFQVLQKKILWHSEVLLLFLSLRYGADLGRSLLVFFKTDSDTTKFLFSLFN